MYLFWCLSDQCACGDRRPIKISGAYWLKANSDGQARRIAQAKDGQEGMRDEG